MIQSITDTQYKKEWNQVVNHPLQSWEWGEVKQKTGNKIIRLAILDSHKKIKQGYLFTLHKLPFNFTLANYTKGTWLNNELLLYLKKYLRKQNCIFLKLEPEVWLEQAGQYCIPLFKKHWQDQGIEFSLSNSAVFARHTFILDLTLSEERLLSLMRPKTRYNIRLARKRGVQVKNMSEHSQGFKIFYSLYQNTIQRQNYLGHNRIYHQEVWKRMHKNGLAKIYVAYYQGEPLVAYQLFYFKNVVYYLYGGSSTEYKEVMASNLLMWEVIRKAKQEGYTQFDFWGALEKDYNSKHSWAGFHRFKQGYGGIHKNYLPTIDVIFKPLEYKGFSLAWPIRNWMLEKNRN